MIPPSRFNRVVALCLTLPFALATPVTGQPADDAWRNLDPERTLIMSVAGRSISIELSPDLAPLHVDRIREIVRAGLFDGGAIIRSQDNYVTQWSTRDSTEFEADPMPPEFEASGLLEPFYRLPDPDTYAPETGFVGGFPVARDPAAGITWGTHCYGAVGVARGGEPTSGDGTSLYVIIGEGPRHLDRNVSIVGRVVAGMEHLSTMPRGSGAMGFYGESAPPIRIDSVRVESDLDPERRTHVQIMRTDSDAFHAFVQSRRSRTEEWFVRPADRIEVCNVAVPSRPVGAE